MKLSAGEMAQLYDCLATLRKLSEATCILSAEPPVVSMCTLTRDVAAAHGLLEKLWFQLKADGTEDTSRSRAREGSGNDDP